MHCDNLMANPFLNFLSKCLCLLWETVWKYLNKHCVSHAALGTHYLTEKEIGGMSDSGKFSLLTTVHINILA